LAQENRRLAAIVFTDIVGFSSLSQRDEAGALRLLDSHNSAVRRVLSRNGGREIKTIGDSFLLEFQSALQAVKFAAEAQEELANPASWGGDSPVAVKIGIHVGDVIERGGDVIGDAVNIASRIVGVAEGGEICVSGHVRDQVLNKVPYEFERLPRQQLKNIDLEVDLYRVVTPTSGQQEVRTPQDGTRIAVLPFSNISPDPGDSYFAEGLTEELIAALSEVRGLRVIARTSVGHYRGTSKGVDQIGRELKVSHVLEGSVRKAGNRIRITASLVDTRSQEGLWSGNFEKDLSDVFSIQSGIAASVVDSLRVKLLSGERVRMESRETDNIAAYVAYLKGRSVMRTGTEEAAHRAQEQFELAIREDGAYAKAYAGKADSVMMLGDYLFTPMPVALEEAKKCVDKALALDPSLAEARVSLGSLLMYEYKFEEAEKEFRKAIELNPSYATGHQWYSSCLQTLGRIREAVEEVLQAEELDPLSPSITLSAIYRTRATSTDEETERMVRKLEEIDPGSPLVDEARMVTRFTKKDWPRALFYLKRMIQRDPADPYLDANLAYICAATGKREEALELVEKLKRVPEDARIKGQLLAFAYFGLGDVDSAFEWWRYAASMKETFFGWIRSFPLFEGMRSDPRYAALLKSVNLPPD
jgi:adenylate cyclase